MLLIGRNSMQLAAVGMSVCYRGKQRLYLRSGLLGCDTVSLGSDVSKKYIASIFRGQAGQNNLIFEGEIFPNQDTCTATKTLMCHVEGRTKAENTELKGKFVSDREEEMEELR